MSNSSIMVPKFYLGSWNDHYRLYANYDKEDIVTKKEKMGVTEDPDYILFMEPVNWQKRLEKINTTFESDYKKCFVARPSLSDRILMFLNPGFNKNQPAIVFRRIK